MMMVVMVTTSMMMMMRAVVVLVVVVLVGMVGRDLGPVALHTQTARGDSFLQQ